MSFGKRERWMIYPLTFDRKEKRALKEWTYTVKGRELVRSIMFPVPFYVVLAYANEIEELQTNFAWIERVGRESDYFYVNVPLEYQQQQDTTD